MTCEVSPCRIYEEANIGLVYYLSDLYDFINPYNLDYDNYEHDEEGDDRDEYEYGPCENNMHLLRLPISKIDGTLFNLSINNYIDEHGRVSPEYYEHVYNYMFIGDVKYKLQLGKDWEIAEPCIVVHPSIAFYQDQDDYVDTIFDDLALFKTTLKNKYNISGHVVQLHSSGYSMARIANVEQIDMINMNYILSLRMISSAKKIQHLWRSYVEKKAAIVIQREWRKYYYRPGKEGAIRAQIDFQRKIHS
jgi:hypothetical protein